MNNRHLTLNNLEARQLLASHDDFDAQNLGEWCNYSAKLLNATKQQASDYYESGTHSLTALSASFFSSSETPSETDSDNPLAYKGILSLNSYEGSSFQKTAHWLYKHSFIQAAYTFSNEIYKQGLTLPNAIANTIGAFSSLTVAQCYRHAPLKTSLLINLGIPLVKFTYDVSMTALSEEASWQHLSTQEIEKTVLIGFENAVSASGTRFFENLNGALSSEDARKAAENSLRLEFDALEDNPLFTETLVGKIEALKQGFPSSNPEAWKKLQETIQNADTYLRSFHPISSENMNDIIQVAEKAPQIQQLLTLLEKLQGDDTTGTFIKIQTNLKALHDQLLEFTLNSPLDSIEAAKEEISTFGLGTDVGLIAELKLLHSQLNEHLIIYNAQAPLINTLSAVKAQLSTIQTLAQKLTDEQAGASLADYAENVGKAISEVQSQFNQEALSLEAIQKHYEFLTQLLDPANGLKLQNTQETVNELYKEIGVLAEKLEHPEALEAAKKELKTLSQEFQQQTQNNFNKLQEQFDSIQSEEGNLNKALAYSTKNTIIHKLYHMPLVGSGLKFFGQSLKLGFKTLSWDAYCRTLLRTYQTSYQAVHALFRAF